MHNNATNPQSERSPNTRQRKELSTKTFSATTFPKTAPLGCVAAQRVPKENAFLAKQQRKTLLVETLLFFKKHNTNTRTCILFVQRHMHTNSHLPPPHVLLSDRIHAREKENMHPTLPRGGVEMLCLLNHTESTTVRTCSQEKNAFKKSVSKENALACAAA